MTRQQLRDAILANLRDSARKAREDAPRERREEKKERTVTFFMG